MAVANMPDKDLPSNSVKARVENAKKKADVSKVVKGNVKKKTTFHELFLSDESAKDIGQYVLGEIIVPRVKDLFFDIVVGSLSKRLYGTHKPLAGTLMSKGGVTKVNYGSMFNGTATTKASQIMQGASPSKADLDVSNIVFDDKSDCDDVLATLCDVSGDFGMASVADFYAAAGMEYDYTLQNFGWLRDVIVRAKVVPTRGGFYLDIMRPGALPK